MSTIQTIFQEPISPTGPLPIPVLEQGDHLTREEFHRRYEAMPHGVKAELIEGVVHIPDHPTFRQSTSSFDLIGWLGNYGALTPGVETGAHCTITLDDENELQPNAVLNIPPRLGGQIRFDDKGGLHRRRSGSHRRGLRVECQLRFAQQAGSVSAQRRSRIHCLARLGPCD